MSKTLEVEKQLAIILKDIYQFEVKEVALILNYSDAGIKKLLLQGRKTLTEIFDQKCALINKDGPCHQCSELSGFFNKKQQQQAELMSIKMARKALKNEQDDFYQLRLELLKNIDPLNAKGSDLHEIFMAVTRIVEGDIESSILFETN